MDTKVIEKRKNNMIFKAKLDSLNACLALLSHLFLVV